MATYEQRTKQIIDALRDADTPIAQIGRIVNRFVVHAGEDPATLTNTEKGEIFVKTFIRAGRDIVFNTARNQARQANLTAEEDAGNTAAADIET